MYRRINNKLLTSFSIRHTIDKINFWTKVIFKSVKERIIIQSSVIHTYSWDERFAWPAIQKLNCVIPTQIQLVWGEGRG
ncbi:hypothetical protein BH10PAT3_BH10PAT3_0570 [soil metagenome]